MVEDLEGYEKMVRKLTSMGLDLIHAAENRTCPAQAGNVGWNKHRAEQDWQRAKTNFNRYVAQEIDKGELWDEPSTR